MTIYAIWRLGDAEPFMLIDAADAQRAIDCVASPQTTSILFAHGYWNSEDGYIALPADPQQLAKWPAVDLAGIARRGGGTGDDGAAAGPRLVLLARPDFSPARSKSK